MRAHAANPPYEVIQRDASAHLVRFGASGRYGCAFFSPQRVAPRKTGGGPLVVQEVDRPCLIMADPERAGRLELTVADPDLNVEGGVSRERPLRLTLRGGWRLQQASGSLCAWPLPEATGAVRVLSATPEATVLEVRCRHGASYRIGLAR